MRFFPGPRPAALLLLLAALPSPFFAQGTRADYERAASLEKSTRKTVFKSKITPRWFAHDTRFWYRNDLPGERHEYVLVDTATGRRVPAFDHARLAEAFTKATGQAAEADRLPFGTLKFPDEGDFPPASVLVSHGSKWWRVDLTSYEVRAEPAGPGDAPAAPRPDDHLTPTLVPHPSTRTGDPVNLFFINSTGEEVFFDWINPEGKRVRYFSLPPTWSNEEATYGGHVWVATNRAGKTLAVFEAADTDAVAVVDPPPPAPTPTETPKEIPAHEGTAAPDRHAWAFFRQDNVFLFDPATQKETPLTTDGHHEDAYSGDLLWSPDSHRLVVLRTKAGDDRRVHLIESSPPDQLQPKLESYEYLKPGDRVPISKPHLFDLSQPGQPREILVPDTLFPNPWDIDNVRWEPDSRHFTFAYNQRGHQVFRILSVDADTGEVRPIVEEAPKTFVDYSGKHFEKYLDGSHELVWMSERDGWNHLYLYDMANDTLKNQITRGPWVVRKVDRVDEKARQIWFEAGGIRPGQDPYYLHFCRVNFDGTGLVVLTEGNGTHSITYSPDRRFLIDTYSRVNLPPVNELRRATDGSLVCELEHAETRKILPTPEPFTAKGRDGATDIYGVIFRPSNLDPARKYPVIENIYAGPQDSFVPKAFQAFYGSQKLAELGFIVVQIDGMGTSNRSKAFHDVCWKNLADAGLPDRILWIKAAAAKYPYFDLARMGIYGTSAGGQSALGALLFHGDFYKAAVADCGCHDNRMDKIWWNEQWMGWPVGPEYAENSNVTHVGNLTGKLLLVVGELDRNVDPASTMQVVNALIKADKDFDLLVVPGAGHGATGSPYGERRRDDFLVRNLLGVEPRAN